MEIGTDVTSLSTQSPPSSEARTALIVGSTGIVGGSLAAHLVDRGWRVYGLARKPAASGGVIPLAADLRDETSVQTALDGIDPTHVFLATWLRQSTEAENVRVNGAMTRNLFAALGEAKSLTHAALVTGTKQYLGPFESYGQTAAETPFREDTPRLPGQNFYYTQEDILFAAAERGGFSWSVHRPHSIVGYALGNAMNMGVTLAVYATICRETGQPFVFPGSHLQWNALTDVTDARLLAKHLEWTALTEKARNQAFNVVNGDVFRWRWLWPLIASYFGIEPAGPPDPIQPLTAKFADAASLWATIADKHALAERDVDKLASWWHTDSDLGRQLECVNDMTKSRLLGFTLYQETRSSFFDLFDRLRREKIIPK
jgi:nucleoside-diphosphate-sugar epimerase